MAVTQNLHHQVQGQITHIMFSRIQALSSIIFNNEKRYENLWELLIFEQGCVFSKLLIRDHRDQRAKFATVWSTVQIQATLCEARAKPKYSSSTALSICEFCNSSDINPKGWVLRRQNRKQWNSHIRWELF